MPTVVTVWILLGLAEDRFAAAAPNLPGGPQDMIRPTMRMGHEAIQFGLRSLVLEMPTVDVLAGNGRIASMRA
jgi:hypothetical protein